MTTIRITARAVVLIIGGRRDPIAEVLDRMPFQAVPWNVMKPEQSAKVLHAALEERTAARVAMLFAHAKAARDVIATARRDGAETIVLRLPNASGVTDGLSEASAVHDLAGPDGLAFEMVAAIARADSHATGVIAQASSLKANSSRATSADLDDVGQAAAFWTAARSGQGS